LIYAKIVDNVITIGSLSELYSNVSFCLPLSDSVKSAYNIYDIGEKDFNPLTQKRENCPPYLEGGLVYQHSVRDNTAEEATKITNSRWNDVREERNCLLTECDFTVLPDSPFTTEERTSWQTYRQQLRDVTTQTDPFNIAWPTKPSQLNNESPVSGESNDS
jgi:hypothetical protein